ncbi:MAG TPA: CBM35 domain-containing protein [Planctomycetota bacterium]|jgi:hypothetical protein
MAIRICLLLCVLAATLHAEEGGADITAAAFGGIYDMSDGAKPIGKGGSHKDIVSGDTWYSTWAGDGTAYLIHDDGLGFDNIGGEFARHRLCRLEGDPNVSTNGFRGVNLNPGLLGTTMPNHIATPEWRIGYSSSVYEQDGALYVIRHNWSKDANLWPPIDSSIIKSTDGGKTWVNHLGQTNAPLPDKEQAMFPSLPWSWLTFIQYGKGNRAPNADNAEKYAYLTASAHLARVLRSKLADLNKNDIEYFKGKEFDGMLDSSWSKAMDDGKPVQFLDAMAKEEEGGISNVVYNAGLQRYVATGWSAYFAPGEGGHDTGKSRFIIYTSKHPWGPWQKILSYGIWGRAGWNFLLCNKYSAPNGRKMWYVFCGEYKGDLWNYGLQYIPLYLSNGAVDIYEAEKAELQGTRIGSEYPSCSGTGYVTGFEKPGDTAKFALNGVNGSGWHVVRVRYTSPLANGRTLSIYVNGRKARRVMLSLNNKDCKPKENWTERSDIYYLKDGVNSLEIRQDEGDSAAGVMIDYIAVSKELTFDEGKNVAPEATVTASSGDGACASKGCVDGIREWSAKEAMGAWIRLEWAQGARTVDRVVLYDRANKKDQVTSGTLSFSDGSSVPVGKLQNDGQAGTVVTFPAKKITWVRFTIDSVKTGTENGGLGEMEVYARAD